MSVIGKQNLYFREFAPNKVKKILTGSGHADKLQMIHMIKLVVKNIALAITDDEADALAVAYAVSIDRELCQISK
jgi:crossover junction endodeoxyribonuclease RuvC